MNKKTKPAGIQTTMLRLYLLLALSLSVAGSGIVFYLFYGIQKSYDDALERRIQADDFALSTDSASLLNRLSRVGGWVEVLDADGRIIRVMGISKDERDAYSPADLELLLSNDPGQDYYYSRASVQQDGKKLTYLVKLPMELVDGNSVVDSEKRNKEKNFYLLTSIAAFVAISLLATWVYSRITAIRINRPLNLINSGIEAMVVGNYDVHLQFQAEYEFQNIRDAFNYMADRLKQAELDKLEMEQARRRLLSDLAHDLKTPLSTIRGFADALASGLVDHPEQIRRYLQTIAKKSERINDLIDSLYQFTLLDHPSFRLELELLDFGELVREIVAEHFMELEEKKFQLVCEIPEERIELSLDKRQIGRAITNLINNALKYNPVGTRLRIETLMSPTEITLEIGDTGIGIDERLRPSLFDPFVRGDESRESSGGTGLGLSICKKIVELHGGTLSLDSSLKEVTLFRIRLPRGSSQIV